jgi:hypothetical protein
MSCSSIILLILQYASQFVSRHDRGHFSMSLTQYQDLPLTLKQLIFVSSLNTTLFQSSTIQSLWIVAKQSFSHTFPCDKQGFGIFSQALKPTSLKAFRNVLSQNPTSLSTLNTFAASIAISSPPTMTKRTISRFPKVVRISRQLHCSNSKLLQCFLLTLFTVDCEKSKDFATSLVFLPLINFFLSRNWLHHANSTSTTSLNVLQECREENPQRISPKNTNLLGRLAHQRLLEPCLNKWVYEGALVFWFLIKF